MKHKVKIWVAIDEEGAYEVGNDKESTVDNFNDNAGTLIARLVNLELDIEIPENQTLTGEVLLASDTKIALKVKPK